VIPPWRHTALAVLILGGVHAGIALMPQPLLATPTNLVLFCANLYVLYCGWLVVRDARPAGAGLFALGYMLLFLLVLVLLERESLFILLVILYASVYRVPVLLGLFVLFVLGYVVFQPYAFETFAPLALAFLAVWQLRRAGASRFVQGCLATGLVALVLVLLPVIHLMIQDSPRTLQYVFSRPDVRGAIWLSLATSAVSTLVVALWGVPLAYAMARGEFRGKGLLESLIDVPILVPQSVVGIALLVLLGPASPLGEALQAAGLTVAGRFAGIVVAQVFVSCPFLIKTAMTAFEGVPAHLEDVSRTLGAKTRTTFFRVTLPLASRGILVGMILAWARAVSEFGAIILFAPHPLTAPVLVHNEFLQAGVSESRPVAVLLLLVCLWIFVLLQFGKTFLPRAFKSTPAGGLR